MSTRVTRDEIDGGITNWFLMMETERDLHGVAVPIP